MSYSNMTFARRGPQEKIAKIIALLSERPMHKFDLSDAMQLNHHSVMKYIRYLHDNKRVYICRWVRNVEQRAYGVRWPAAVWAAGDKPDRPKPEPIPMTEHWKRSWQKIKASPEKLDNRNANRRRRHMVKNKIKPADPIGWMTTHLEYLHEHERSD